MSTTKRPRSLTFVAVIAMIVYGFGYAGLVVVLSTDDELSWSRLLNEPAVQDGGIQFPGWDALAFVPEADPKKYTRPGPDLDKFLEYNAARYWWNKVNILWALFVGAPLLLLGWYGMFLGRRWGRTVLYLYLPVWLADKVAGAFILPDTIGIPRVAAGLVVGVILVLMLRSASWKVWIDSRRPIAESAPFAGT